jgi:hypothetical protein
MQQTINYRNGRGGWDLLLKRDGKTGEVQSVELMLGRLLVPITGLLASDTIEDIGKAAEFAAAEARKPKPVPAEPRTGAFGAYRFRKGERTASRKTPAGEVVLAHVQAHEGPETAA